ncbi:hypothetical protein HYN43_002460 [Mucilaginibacter celer]|uniref:Uncharacterized protein n=1 Tax=Mucilaginibacter celer TaxID=2305508 RepID=A0A494VS79_9SPHI|nr:hypothetical protein HYN43_002460 [Mucilaginibacter celer]
MLLTSYIPDLSASTGGSNMVEFRYLSVRQYRGRLPFVMGIYHQRVYDRKRGTGEIAVKHYIAG